ncbi:hypothetical protein DKG74_14375 [Zavarzinia aquatilis]|uniref:Uncharacterized protein n=1 Tax=Zavarzinia aquatilis TaxID=2211142 RepID=A0A317E2G5_9PROT|nr:hypothetical protein DKG74_14375 [Zavarzinia aquatilis]
MLGAIGYDLTTERIAQAHAAVAPAPSRPAGEVSNEGVERLVVIPLQPGNDARRPIRSSDGGPGIERMREEMGSAVRLIALAPSTDKGPEGAAYVDIPPAVARKLAGGLARITLWTRADRKQPSAEFGMALSVDGSFPGWLRFPTGPATYESYSFVVPVPASAAGKPLRVLIAPDTKGGNGAISASHMIVDRILKPGEPEPSTEGAPVSPATADQPVTAQ